MCYIELRCAMSRALPGRALLYDAAAAALTSGRRAPPAAVARPWRAQMQEEAPTHHPCGPAGLLLAHHALADVPRLERVVEPEASDVAVRADALDARQVLHLRHLEARLHGAGAAGKAATRGVKRRRREAARWRSAPEAARSAFGAAVGEWSCTGVDRASRQVARGGASQGAGGGLLQAGLDCTRQCSAAVAALRSALRVATPAAYEPPRARTLRRRRAARLI
jgi:hypothetical protein